MPRFSPFPAIRYAGDLAPVVAPPYDVLSPADVAELRDRSGHNIVRVDVPDGGPERYAPAAARLRAWLETGVLVREAEPTFTIYRMRFADPAGATRTISGVLGGLEVVDAGTGGVLPHERTTPKASTDRLDLTRATRANLSPVWGLSLAGGLTEVLAEPGDPLGSVAVDGVEHVVERVGDPERVAAISAAVAADDVLIADGHHRYGISRTYRDEVRAATGRTDTPAEETLTFVNELVADQLSVAPIHRLYADVTVDQLLTALDRFFELTATVRADEAAPAAMQAGGFLLLATTDRTWQLRPKPGAFDGVRALDGVWLETALAGVPAAVTYQHGVTEALAAVQRGAAAATVLIRPVGVAEITRTAREGLLMPPKSTFFTPKLRTGLVVRPLT